MKHPSQEILALHAGGDLGWMARWKTARHVAGCEECSAEVASFSELREELPELSQMPEVPWNRIAGEMRANIRLGLAAGECVRFSDRPLRDSPLFTGARATLAVASVLALMALRRHGFRADALRREQCDVHGRSAGNTRSALHGPGNRERNDDESICRVM